MIMDHVMQAFYVTISLQLVFLAQLEPKRLWIMSGKS
jgi:hypothetical protein